jgi:serine/threonine protein kinase
MSSNNSGKVIHGSRGGQISEGQVLRIKSPTSGQEISVRLIVELGQGISGQVFEVEFPDQTRWALKVSTTGTNSVLTREVQVYRAIERLFAGAAMNNIGVCKGIYSGTGFCCLQLELYGPSILKSWENGPLTLRTVQSLAKSLLSAVSILHRTGYVHCDIKPENILMENDSPGTVRLIDFAGALSEDELARSQMAIQTSWYRAPECFLDGPRTPAIDLWSVGCVLAEAFLGNPIFAGPDDSMSLRLMEARLGEFPRDFITLCHAERLFVNGRMRVDQGSRELVDKVDMSIEENGVLVPASLSDAVGYLLAFDNCRRLGPMFFDFLQRLLTYDPRQRLSADAALGHEFVTSDSG